MRGLLAVLLFSTFALQAASPEEALARAIDEAANENNVEGVAKCFDEFRFFARMHEGLSGDEAEWEAFAKPLRGNFLLGQLYCSWVREGNFHFLRMLPKEQFARALFRHCDATGVNHVEILIDHTPAGLRAIDHKTWSTGELQSREFQDAYLFNYLRSTKPEVLKKLVDANKELGPRGEAHAAAETLQEPLRAREFAQVLELYRQLPAAVQIQKPILLIRLNAATWLEKKDWSAAFDDLKKHFPDDPALEIFSIDGAIREKNVDAALKAIDVYDKRVGGDPYFDFLRASAFEQAGRGAEAIAHAKKVVEAIPDLRLAYVALLHAYIAARDYNSAVLTLSEFDRRFTVNVQRLLAEPKFAEFIVSEPYRNWLKKRSTTQ